MDRRIYILTLVITRQEINHKKTKPKKDKMNNLGDKIEDAARWLLMIPLSAILFTIIGLLYVAMLSASACSWLLQKIGYPRDSFNTRN